MTPEYYSHMRRGVTRAAMINMRLAEGAHVHTVKHDDEYCAGGDSECPLFQVQLEEAVEAWSE